MYVRWMFTSFYIEENREDIIIITIMMDEAMPADECSVLTTNDPMSTLCRNVHALSVTMLCLC